MWIRVTAYSAVMFTGLSAVFAIDDGTTSADPETMRYISQLKHDDAGKRAAAARILGSIGDQRAIPALSKATHDNPRVRWDAAFAIAAISEVTSVPSAAGPKGRTLGQIVFPLRRNGRVRIHSIFSDGTGLKPCTRGPGDYEAALSRNGRTLVFCGSNQRVIRVRDMKSGKTRTLASVPLGVGLSGPKISDDGRLVLYRRDEQVFVTRSDATKHVFRSLKSLSAGYYGADISGNGKRIAFDSAGELFVSDATGARRRRVTKNGPRILDISPSLSRDGKRIAYMSGNYPDWDIWVAQTDGTGKRNVSRHRAIDSTPVISPDGTMVAFTSDRSGSREIYLVGFDGNGLVRLTDGDSHSCNPRFSSDGKMIFFETAHKSDRKNLCAMNVDGRGLRVLVQDMFGPKWWANGIEFVIQPQKKKVRAGEDVTIQFRLKNRTNAAIRLGKRMEVKLFLPNRTLVEAGGHKDSGTTLPKREGGTLSFKSGNEIQFTVTYPWKRIFPLMAKHRLTRGSARLTAEVICSDGPERPFHHRLSKPRPRLHSKTAARQPRVQRRFSRTISSQPIILRSRR